MMIDKRSGNVRHVVIGFGGLFGMGEDSYPIPWDALHYDTDKGGYVTRFNRDKMDRDKMPSYQRDQQPDWNDDYDRRIRLYYFPG